MLAGVSLSTNDDQHTHTRTNTPASPRWEELDVRQVARTPTGDVETLRTNTSLCPLTCFWALRRLQLKLGPLLFLAPSHTRDVAYVNDQIETTRLTRVVALQKQG